ncbi:uncharacterized protein DS421_14g474270 [Arachis hypogaea]|nr:uncharacterized protein DS421_14g474270 [Arachis hypogaea]
MGERGKTTRDAAGVSMAVRNCHLPPPLLGFAAGAPLKGRPFSHAEQERQRDLKVCWEPNTVPGPRSHHRRRLGRNCHHQKRVLVARSGSATPGTTAGASGYSCRRQKFAVDPPEFLAAAGAVAAAGSKSELLRVVIPCCDGCCECDWELRF